MKVLIFGYSGLIGSHLYRRLSKSSDFSLVCLGRSENNIDFLQRTVFENFDANIDASLENLSDIIFRHQPNFIINSMGIIKQRIHKPDLGLFHINSVFPKKLAKLIENTNIKMVQLSTDCVFDGIDGNYKETDFPYPPDDYGMSKFLGEITHNRNVLTLRTSFIGHELSNKLSLLEWFLKQNEAVSGYKKAFYSGLTAVEVADVICKYILSNFQHGLFHLGGNRISKFELLSKIKAQYSLNHIDICPNFDVISNKTLNCQKFQNTFDYKQKTWDDLIQEMHSNFLEWGA